MKVRPTAGMEIEISVCQERLQASNVCKDCFSIASITQPRLGCVELNEQQETLAVLSTEQEGTLAVRSTEQQGVPAVRSTEQQGALAVRSTEQQGTLAVRSTEQH